MPGHTCKVDAAKTATGSAIPLRCLRPRAVNPISPDVRVRLRTVSLTRTSPATAWAQMRAAMFTAEPTYPSAVSVDSPAWIPTPTRIGRSGRSADAEAAAAAIASPQRTASLADGKTT